ncbi:PssD/Cps14F family polysaccharide biosynthesis glycosyltransferase [Sediminibacillus massiliensis]|uniref:PssD/Cps14F family polysaccharide biosynthesis glycosyltransferase n=1 Tax=Sediminibacillus massiliensis TaxID=1926277 RepID=UPI0009887396|nr:PssD/Cps14F family polysaccharide biosynthesis glycosyltransferase [Sediminibacillus massiliensis]
MGKVKLCLASSTGGHLTQLLQLEELSGNYDTFWVSEKSETSKNLLKNKKKYYFIQQDRKQKAFIFKFLFNIFNAIFILAKERPNVIITTGAGVVIPLCVFSKLINCKVIFIESFAKVDSPTITGKLLYKLKVINKTYVQSEKMLKHYETAVYRGTLY